MASQEEKATDFNLHIGGDGVKTNMDVPRDTTTFFLSVVAAGLVAYLTKNYIKRAFDK